MKTQVAVSGPRGRPLLSERSQLLGDSQSHSLRAEQLDVFPFGSHLLYIGYILNLI